MIHAKAGCVERGRIREAGVELRQSVPKFRAVGDGIRVQEWKHGGWGLLPRCHVRNGGFLRGWLA